MTGLIPVYRASDMNAAQDVEVVRNLLVSSGLDAAVADDNHGLPDGTFEVRVPSDQADRAREILNAGSPLGEAGAAVDRSSDLDMVTLRRFAGATGEIQALGTKGILDSIGINSVVVGSSSLPNLSFFLKVAQADAERANAAIQDADANAPAAAEEADRQFNQGS
jgi:hypothetical protein